MVDSDIRTLDDLKHEADPDIEILALRRQVEGLKSEVKSMQADYGDLKGYFRDLDVTALSLKTPKALRIYKPTKDEIKVKTPCVAVLHWTDWHYGAV